MLLERASHSPHTHTQVCTRAWPTLVVPYMQPSPHPLDARHEIMGALPRVPVSGVSSIRPRYSSPLSPGLASRR